MGIGTYIVTMVMWGIYPTRGILFAYAPWPSDIKVVIVEGKPGEVREDQEHRSWNTKVMVVKR
jgi:hypothetical protein